MENIQVFVMNYNELDRLVNKNLFPDKDDDFFEFIAVEEMGNDSEKLFRNISKNPKYGWEEKDLEEFLNGDISYGTCHALTELCKRDLIQEENYLISVCW